MSTKSCESLPDALEGEKVSFFSAHMQRRASPAVPRVHLSPMGQQVTDDQMLIGSGSTLQSRLSIMLSGVQHTTCSHLLSQHKCQCSAALCHRDVKPRVTVLVLHAEQLRRDSVQSLGLLADLPLKQSHGRFFWRWWVWGELGKLSTFWGECRIRPA